jgi:hypothetical protein
MVSKKHFSSREPIRNVCFLRSFSIISFRFTLSLSLLTDARIVIDMTRVTYQRLPLGVCGKQVGRAVSDVRNRGKMVMFVGDSNLRAVINGQCAVPG